MKTKITFELESKTSVKIIRDGKQIGSLWSESKDSFLPYPHEKDKDYCQNSVQLCGFHKLDGDWACGNFENTRDIVAHFRNDGGEYMQGQIKQYLKYVETFLEATVKSKKIGNKEYHAGHLEVKKPLGKMMNFDDWFRTGGVFD